MRRARRMRELEPATFGERVKAFGEIRRAVELVWQSAPGIMIWIAFLTLLLSVLPLAALLLLRRLLDQLLHPWLEPGVSLTRGDLIISVEWMAIVAFAILMCRSLQSLAAEIQGLRVADHMKSILHAKSIELDLEFYENPDHQDRLRRAQQEAPHRPVRIVNALLQLAQSGLSVLALGGFLVVTLHWGFFAALLLAAVPGLWVRSRQARENFELQRRQTVTERVANYMDFVLTHEWFAKEVRLFGLGGYFSERSKEYRAKLTSETTALAKRRSKREIVTHFFTTAALFGAVGVVAFQAVRGVVTFGSLVMYYQALQRAQAGLQEFLGGLTNMYENTLFLRNLNEFLEQKPRLVQAANPRKVPATIREGLIFENVSFAYPGKDALVLEDVSFQIRVGEKMALVGENGSGKTTLVKLMCRLYDPTRGRILMAGVDIREFDVAELRRQFSVIFQDFVRYHLSIAENIALGNIEETANREKIIAAATRAGADALAKRFPQEYDTLLGRVLHEGEEISGGEWQKIALARAFLRESPFIIMDEPTSAMDARAEYMLFRRFAEMAQGRAAILISHRLSTVRMADSILFLEKGRIAERGHHDELVALGGSYARLFEMQAKNYR